MPSSTKQQQARVRRGRERAQHLRRTNVIVERFHELLWRVLSGPNTTIVLQELLFRHLLSHRDIGVVGVGVEHNETEGQDEGSVLIWEHIWVVLKVSVGE